MRRRTIGRLILPLTLAALFESACGLQPESETQTPTEEPPTTAEPSPIAGVTLRQVPVGDLSMRIAEAGNEGPLVLLVHGWPESWYSWRHQLVALADAGYRAVAPDMRGYGGTDAPPEVEDYDVLDLCGDLTGLLDVLGESTAALVGHDWGAAITWNCALLAPERFQAMVAMSVPYGGHAQSDPLASMRQRFGDNFYYMLYFQELDEQGRGVAEAEFDPAPRAILSRLYASPGTPRNPPAVTDPLRSAGGWIPRLGEPTELPPWLSAADLDYYVTQFEHTGFRGGINYYRNIGRNWELTPQLAGAKVKQPALFLAGERDVVIRGATQEQLEATIGPVAEDLRGVHVVPGVGHWIQQEAPEEVNRLLLDFLGGL